MVIGALLLFPIGLAVGSFLNVCIYRIPIGLSIVKPSRSFCPSCGSTISWYDNIPLLSYLILRGRCRHCGARISPRYPAVELITGLLFSLLYLRFGLSVELPEYIVMGSILIAVSAIDIRHYIIPLKLTGPGMGIGLAFAAGLAIKSGDVSVLIERLLGGAVGAGAIFAVGVIGSLIFKKEAMGLGDVELMGMIGLYLGLYPHVILVILLSAVLGSLVGLALIAAGRKGPKSQIPYGPFLAGGALISAFYGREIWGAYLRVMGF
ncbi:prepilin peptidase [Candidatus Poribacteria bacterium]|nr:MAG: prepilin peptidase [Candidatus Poribacteria bacterium]